MNRGGSTFQNGKCESKNQDKRERLAGIRGYCEVGSLYSTVEEGPVETVPIGTWKQLPEWLQHDIFSSFQPTSYPCSDYHDPACNALIPYGEVYTF
jgi:hypothetical protein